MVLSRPAIAGVLVVLVEQQPLFLAGGVGPRPYEHEPAAQLFAGQVGVQLAALYRVTRIRRIARLVRLPRAGVPDDDVAGAVPAGRDHALEVEVLKRMVLDLERGAPDLRIERRSLRHRPTHEHTVDLEAHVVMEAAGAMPLYDEAPLAGAASGRGLSPGRFGGCSGALARWLRGTGEVALAAVRRE